MLSRAWLTVRGTNDVAGLGEPTLMDLMHAGLAEQTRRQVTGAANDAKTAATDARAAAHDAKGTARLSLIIAGVAAFAAIAALVVALWFGVAAQNSDEDWQNRQTGLLLEIRDDLVAIRDGLPTAGATN